MRRAESHRQADDGHGETAASGGSAAEAADEGERARRRARLRRRRREVRRRRAVALLVLAVLAVSVVLVARGASEEPAARTTTGGARPPTGNGATPAGGAGPAPGGEVSIGWAGDIALHGDPPEGAAFFADVHAALRRPQLMIGNLEGTLSSGGTSKCGGGENCFAFQAPTRYARVLRDAGFDAANLANNHAFDFGAAGQAQTVRALRQAGVAITGRPGEITVRRVGGIRVALLGFAPYAWASRLDDIPSAAALVRRAAGRAEVVVVTMHAGAEGPAATRVPEGVEHYLGENRGDVRAFARAVIAAGADLVLGSGPHVVRGVERFRGRLIVYSTGNFAGHRSLSVRGVLAAGAVVHVTVRGDGTVARGRWISTLLVGQGRPVLDPAGTSLALARRLSRQDFPRTAARIDANGTIRP